MPVCNQIKEARMNVKEPKTMSKRTPFKAVPDRGRKRTPFKPGGTPPQERQTWHGPPSARPPELEEEAGNAGRSENSPWPWNARERTVLNGELPEEKAINFMLGLANRSISCSAQFVMRSASCLLRRMRVVKEDARSLRCSKRSEA